MRWASMLQQTEVSLPLIRLEPPNLSSAHSDVTIAIYSICRPAIYTQRNDIDRLAVYHVGSRLMATSALCYSTATICDRPQCLDVVHEHIGVEVTLNHAASMQMFTLRRLVLSAVPSPLEVQLHFTYTNSKSCWYRDIFQICWSFYISKIQS